MGKGCAVEYCQTNLSDDNIETRRFRFPRNEVRCKLWVERCRNKGLLTLSAETLNATKRICGLHFAPHAFVNALKKRLVHDAVPSIFHFNLEESDQPKEPMVWNPKRSLIAPDIKKKIDLVVPKPLLQPETVLLPDGPSELNVTEHASLKDYSKNNPQWDPVIKFQRMPPNIINSKVSQDLRSASLKQTITESSNIPNPTVSKPNLGTPSSSGNVITNLMDLEPNIWEKHMELFQQSEGKEFLIVGEVCMIAEKDPNQMCGSVKCNDDLYSSKTSEQLVRCWSRCKKWFHLRCTDLTAEEYRVLSNKESLRWLCEECCKDDIF